MPKSQNIDNYDLFNISTGVGVQVTARAGVLEAITFNNAGSTWEVDLYDGTSSTSGRSIGKIRGMSTPQTLFFMGKFLHGLFIDTVKGTTVGDLTVTFLDTI